MTKRLAALGLALAALLCAGCASVTQGTTHILRIDTVTDAGRQVDGADCTLSNDHGTTIAKSGASTLVRRSSQDLAVVCTSGGLPKATAQLVSRANAGLAGNIIIGGGIGALIDHTTGSAYTYPGWVQLVFGQHAVFDRRSEREGVVMLAGGAPGSVTAAAAPGAGAAPATATPRARAASPTPAATAASIAAIVRRGLAAGDRFDYRITDRGSGRIESVSLHAERVDGTQVSFNNGARVEGPTGEPVRLATALVGELDQVTPPGGWMPSGREPRGAWKMRYGSVVPAPGRSYDLEANVEGEQKLRVGDSELRTLRVSLDGWVESRGGFFPVRAAYHATAWVAPELGRVVRFQAKARTGGDAGGAHFEIDETSELVAVGRD